MVSGKGLFFYGGGAIFFFFTAASAYSSDNIHRTKAASEKQHDLWCYRCDTMVDGERCLNLTANSTNIHAKCSKEQKKCQVRRISVSTSTEEVTGRQRLWLLRRNCTETCEAGCIIIGERTKLHSCITCCDENNFCNAGNSSGRMHVSSKCKRSGDPAINKLDSACKTHDMAYPKKQYL